MVKKILSLSFTTTPSIVTGSYSADPDYGTLGIGYGRVAKCILPIQVIRAAASGMTAVKFKIEVCRDPSAPVWVGIPSKLASDPNGTLGLEKTLAVTANTTSEDFLITENAESTGALRVVAEAVTHDAEAGDSCGVWMPL